MINRLFVLLFFVPHLNLTAQTLRVAQETVFPPQVEPAQLGLLPNSSESIQSRVSTENQEIESITNNPDSRAATEDVATPELSIEEKDEEPTFDKSGELHCEAYAGAYDEVAKFSIRAMRESRRRDLVLHTQDIALLDACWQNDKILRCDWGSGWRRYSLWIYLGEHKEIVDIEYGTRYFEVSGVVDRSFASKHPVSCRQ